MLIKDLMPGSITITPTGTAETLSQALWGTLDIILGVLSILGAGTITGGTAGLAVGVGAALVVVGEGLIVSGSVLITNALINSFEVSYSSGSGQDNSNKENMGDSETPKNKILDNDSTTGHIFRDAEGHIPDTPENRALLEDVANDPANFRGTDKYGNEWYTKTQSDGSQVWVESRNGNIFEGGVNDTPKPWNSGTGLKKP